MKADVLPFLKWAGGKRWLVNNVPDLFPEDFAGYYEPFLGSGAVFFRLNPREAVLNDSNSDLIDAYIQIRDNWAAVFDALRSYHKKHSKDFYYRMRAYKPRLPHLRAARFIYLNRTCWNGLYRVNLTGEFNVPVGSKKNVILDTDDFEKVSACLNGVEIVCSDFESVIERSTVNDFLFVDPPYTVMHNNNGFIKYNEKIFSWDDQLRLKDALSRASDRGVKIMMTNAKHDSIIDLYNGFGELVGVDRDSMISGKKSSRGKYSEIIVKNY